MSNVTQLLFFLAVLQIPPLYRTDELQSSPYDWNTPRGLQISNNPFSPHRNLLKAIQQNREIKSLSGEAEDETPFQNRLDQPDIPDILSNDLPNEETPQDRFKTFDTEKGQDYINDDYRPSGNFEVENKVQGSATHDQLMNPLLARSSKLLGPPARLSNDIRSPSNTVFQNGMLENQPRINQIVPSQLKQLHRLFEEFTQNQPLIQTPGLGEFIPLPLPSSLSRNRGYLPRHESLSFPPPFPAYKDRLHHRGPIPFPPLPFRYRGNLPPPVALPFPPPPPPPYKGRIPPPFEFKGHAPQRRQFPFPLPPFGFRDQLPRQFLLPFPSPPLSFGFMGHYPRRAPLPFPLPPFGIRDQFPHRAPFPPPPFGIRHKFPRRAPFPLPPFGIRDQFPRHAPFPPLPFGIRDQFPRRAPFPPLPFGIIDQFPRRTPFPFPLPPFGIRDQLPRRAPFLFPQMPFRFGGYFPRRVPFPFPLPSFGFRGHLPPHTRFPFPLPPYGLKEHFPSQMPSPFPPRPRGPVPFQPSSRLRGHLLRHIPSPFPPPRFGNGELSPRSMPKPFKPSPVKYREELPFKAHLRFLSPPAMNRGHVPPQAMPPFLRSPKIPQQPMSSPIFSYDKKPFQPLKRLDDLPFNLQMRKDLSYGKGESPLSLPLKHGRPFLGDRLPGLPSNNPMPPNSSPYVPRDDLPPVREFDLKRSFPPPKFI
ncbi:uncharacterized protein LOC134261870 [Saccostrea cucullata]|uniref:uncharacterized protein LOC134261870 n=1 Tax=Saccostrea cuccullata TaxID=36930 RepID=UPI002ED6209D